VRPVILLLPPPSVQRRLVNAQPGSVGAVSLMLIVCPVTRLAVFTACPAEPVPVGVRLKALPHAEPTVSLLAAKAEAG